MQSDFKDNILDLIKSQTITVDLGESSTVTFEDNSITTVNVTKSGSDVVTTISNDTLKHTFSLASGDGVGDTFNSLIVKMNSDGMNKCLFNEITKTSTQVIQFEIQETFLFE